MALPKRRHSRSRRDKRRTHWKLKAPSFSLCSNCHQPKLPHRACPNCGYYSGRSIFLPKEA
ncbi:MAG: 50S ribosomal protein L32 [Calditrichaeota bacterium]|nr:MAG: 50S ribosomal protein L32 [Calditrichota bacterium]